MPQRLTQIRLDEISLVDQPANKGARIVFFKRDAPTVPANAKISKLAKVLASAFTKVGGDVTEEDLEAAILEATGPDDGKEPTKEEPAGDPPKDDDKKDDKVMADELAKVTAERDELKKRVDELDGQVKKAAVLEDRLAKAEKTIADSAGTIAGFQMREQVGALTAELEAEGVADPKGTAESLLKMADADMRKSFKDRFISDARIIKSGAAFVGSASTEPGGVAGSAEAEIVAKATKLAEERKIPYAEAYTDVYKADPRLRAKVEAEEAAKRRRAA